MKVEAQQKWKVREKQRGKDSCMIVTDLRTELLGPWGQTQDRAQT